MQFVSAYVIVLVIFGIFDAIWLSMMGPMLYRPVLGDILLDKVRIAPALVFYAIFPIGIVFFAVRPALENNAAMTALTCGLLFGALAYATYDLTNFATLRNWSLQITVLDIVYGAVVSGIAASAAILIMRHLPASLGGIPS